MDPFLRYIHATPDGRHLHQTGMYVRYIYVVCMYVCMYVCMLLRMCIQGHKFIKVCMYMYVWYVLLARLEVPFNDVCMYVCG